MIVISDTSSITSITAINQLDLLDDLIIIANFRVSEPLYQQILKITKES